MIPTPTPIIPVGGIIPISIGRQSRAARAMEQPQFSKTTTIPFTSTSPEATGHLEEALTKLTINTNTFMEENRSNFKNLGESIQNLETHVSQLAKQLATMMQQILTDSLALRQMHRI
ncbi:hypothetical protein PIB30_068524, partial [Stylosanthes scabra]|nr:hypothetical protein [Stylosanthes scabra]